MCETPQTLHAGWRGWPDVPESPLSSSRAPWVDLTLALNADLPRWHLAPPPEFPRLYRLPESPYNETAIRMGCHMGTHLDAPFHFLTDGPAVHEIPLHFLVGGGAVVAAPAGPGARIEAEALEHGGAHVRAGDILLIHSGFAARLGEPSYGDHPYLSDQAARWIVSRGIKLVGVDFGSPDAPHSNPERRTMARFDFPVHRILLAAGVLIAEHLGPLGALAGRRIDALVLPLPIEGADGAPARILARPAAAD